MQLLHIDSSVLGPHSASRALSAEIVARQVALRPGITVVHRDLAADAALHLSSGSLGGMAGRRGRGRGSRCRLGEGRRLLGRNSSLPTSS